MTREEAIQFLDNMKHEEAGRAIGKDRFYAELMGYHVEALNIAIKALEHVERNVVAIVPCEDAISRQAVIDEMYKRKANGDAITAGFIKNLKPVTPQPKTGHWIVHEKPNGIRYLECSCCNIWYLNEHLLRNSYCSNCGAKMVEPQEREDKG